MISLYQLFTSAPLKVNAAKKSPNYSFFKGTPTEYPVSKNQNSKKWRLLTWFATMFFLSLLPFVGKAQAPTVIDPWVSLDPTIVGVTGIMTADAAGNLYTIVNKSVSNLGVTNDQVVKITPSGSQSFISLGGVSARQGTAIAIDPFGNLYVAITQSGTTTKITRTVPGGATTDWVTFTTPADPIIKGMAFDAAGNLYTANSNYNQVSKISSTGSLTQNWATLANNTQPYCIEVDAGGNVYTGNVTANTVSKITPTGTVTQTWATLAVDSRPQSMTFDASGNLYTANFLKETVSKITPTGVVTTAFATLKQTVIDPILNMASVYGARPLDILYNQESNALYTANPGDSSISKISLADGTTIQRWVTGILYPVSLVYFNKDLLVSSNGLKKIVKVTLPPNTNVTFNQTQPTCANSNNGGLRAIAIGCSANPATYSYLWTPGGATTDTISNLAPGTYSVRVVCGTDTVNKSITLTAATVVASPFTSNQSVCSGATVADLLASPAPGNTIVWYATATGGTPLASSTPLVNATKYYAAQVTSANCESNTRAVDSVTIGGLLNPRNDTTFCSSSNVNIIFGAAPGPFGGGGNGSTYNWTATQNGTGIAASGTNAISFTANNTTSTVKKDTVFLASNFTIPLSYGIKDSTYYFADTTGSTYLNANTTSPTPNPDFPLAYSPGGMPGNLTDSISIGFTFNFYGVNRNKLFIGRGGRLQFNRASNFTTFPGAVIEGYNALWDFDAQSKVAYKTSGTAPNRKFIVTYINLKVTAIYAGGNPVTTNPVSGRGIFQIVLNETSNTIEVLHQLIPSASTTSGPIGFIREGIYDVDNGGGINVPGRNGGSNTLWVKIENENKIFFPIPATTCSAQKDTFAISVLPTPKVDSIANITICPSSTVAAINFTTPITDGTVGYKWTNNNTAIGLAASGTGNIPSFTAAATAQTSTISVRPYMLKSATDTCFGTARTFVINADLPPAPTTVDSIVVYTGTKTINQLDVTPLTGGTLNYYYEATGGTALAGSTIVVDDTTFYITQTVAGCESNPRKQIKVNRIANDSIVLCSPDSVASLTATPLTGNTAKWYDAASGGTALNSSAALFVGQDTLYVNEENSVSGAGKTNRVPVIVIANPTATVTATTDKVVCNNNTVTAVNFSSPTTGGTVTYAWTNNKTSIGLAATGTGNIASFTAVNNSTGLDTAMVIVTPTITNAGVSCAGARDTFLIIVNPPANVNTVSNQVVCNGNAVTAINFGSTNTGGTVTYAWTNNTTSIGLAATGNGNIATFNGVNSGTTPVTATIVVTPTFTSGGVSCAGPTKTFTITVNPTVTVNPENDQIVCNGAASTAINFSTPATSGTTTYAWTNDKPANGLAASGTGNIASFTAVNNGTAPDTATIIITPTFANGGTNCVGTKDTIYIVVNPTAKINAITDKVACNGSPITATMPTSTATGGTVTYAWTNNTTSIGLAASGTGTIPSFTGVNTSSTAVTATIIVTPTFTNGGISCVGTNDTFNITINPPPIFAATADKYVCNAATTTPVVFTTALTGGTAVYKWTNSNTAIGLAASGTGNVPSFTATNTTTAPIMGSIVVYMEYTNAGLTCTSLRDTFNYVVNPTAMVNPVNDQELCNGATTAAINFATTATGGTTTYAWTNNKPSIGLAASGTGNIAAFTAVNNSNAPDTAMIIVTATFANGGTSCTGAKDTFYIAINPTAKVNTVNNQVVCAGSTNNAVTFSTPVAGTTYTWTNNNPSIGLAASGSGNVPSFIAVNPNPNALTATITVTPNTAAGCIGQPITYTITVNGLSVAPTSINNPTPIVCANNAFATLSVNGGTLGSGAVWKWYADSLNTVSIGTGATLANIPVAKTTTYFVRAEGTCNNTAAASVVVQRANLVHHVRQHWSDVLLFDNSSRNYVAWQWYKNGVAVNGATLQQYSESSALVGTYHVVATDKNGEKTITCPLTITAGSFTGLRISLFPNPTDKNANVKVATSFSISELQGATITVSDIYGRVIRQITNVSPNTTIQAPAATGMYIVTLTLQNGVKYSANLLTN